jgi:hypothetical protein
MQWPYSEKSTAVRVRHHGTVELLEKVDLATSIVNYPSNLFHLQMCFGTSSGTTRQLAHYGPIGAIFLIVWM